MTSHKQPGFILLLTFLMLSMTIAMATYLMMSTQASKAIGSTVIAVERAQDVALSGVELVRRVLSNSGDPDGTKHEIESILRFINRWRNFDLHTETDGVEGTIAVYVACEEGKININSMFDLEKKQFIFDEKDDFTKDLWTRVGTIFRSKTAGIGVTDFKDFLVRHLKDRKEPLDDISELFTDEPLVHTPPIFTPQTGATPAPLGVIDLLAVSEFMEKMQPVFLSRGMCELLGFKMLPSDDDGREKIIKELVSKVKLDSKISWAREWDKILAPIYGKTFNQIEGRFRWTTFDQRIGALTISVVCYGKMSDKTVGVFALLRRRVEQDKRVVYHVKKLYWI